MKTDFAILVPTKFEAQLVPAKIRDKEFFVISGVLRLTTRKIINLIEKKGVKKIVLLGFAGDLKKNDRIGTALSMNMVADKDHTLRLQVLKELGLKTASCITSKKPVYSELIRKRLSQYADLVEMECWWAAELCKQKNIQFYSVRIVSDNANSSLSDYFFFKKKPSPELLLAQKKLAETCKNIMDVLS